MNRSRTVVLVLLLVGLVGAWFYNRRQHAGESMTGGMMDLAGYFPSEFANLNEEDEGKFGDKLVAQLGLTPHEQMVTDPDERALLEYLIRVGGHIADQAKRRAYSFHFHLDPSDEFADAIALPGGHVLVGRGLLRMMSSEDALAGFLGHAIAHGEAREAAPRLQSELAKMKLELPGLFRAGIDGLRDLEAGYTAQQEMQADARGLQLAVAAGYSPAPWAETLLKMNGQAADALPASLAGAVKDYARSHPAASERVAAYQKESGARGWKAAPAAHALGVRAILLSIEAQELNRDGDFSGAVARLNQAISADPGFVRGRRALATTVWRSGDAKGAEDAALEALRQDPDAWPMWELVAKAEAVTDCHTAVAHFEQSLAQLPPKSEAAKAHVHIQRQGLGIYCGGDAQALASHAREAAAETDPHLLSYRLLWMGWWLYRAGKPMEALAELEGARKAFPEDPGNELVYGFILSDLGRAADVAAALERAAKLSAPGPTRMALKALLEWRENKREEARNDFRRAADMDAAWLEPRWVSSTYSAAATAVFRQLQSQEIARRKIGKPANASR